MSINKYRSALLQAARESLEESVFADVPASTDADIAQGNVLVAEEETAAIACEALNAEASRLERLFTAIKDIPSSKATPELIETIQATATAESKPSIATEADEPGAWEKTKSYVGKAAAATGEAAKKAAKWLVEMITKFIDWVLTTRKGTERKLQEAKAGMANAKDRVDVKNVRQLTPLTYKGSFGFQPFKSSMTRYAQSATAFVVGLDGAANIDFARGEFSMVTELTKQFVTRSGAVLKWQDGKAQLFDGQGGHNVVISIDDKNHINADVEREEGPDDTAGSARTASATFSKQEASQIVDMGLALLKGLDKVEGPIKKLKDNLNRLDFVNNVQGNTLEMSSRGNTYRVEDLIAAARSLVTVAMTWGAKPVLEAAHAAGNFAEAFIKGTDIEEDASQSNGAPKAFTEPQLAK